VNSLEVADTNLVLSSLAVACGGADIECNGNGQCLSLYDLAPMTRVNGVTQGFTYGEDPNDVTTWDAHRIRTCLCDPFFFGYDCSLRTLALLKCLLHVSG
jgi:hypothetical protein